MSTDTILDETVIACTPDAVPTDKRARWMQIGLQVYAAVQQVVELPDGYACRLPGDANMMLQAMEYVSLDRLCCKFARWTLVVEPNEGPLWLRITGAEGTKEYMQEAFEATPLLDESVARAAGFSVANRTVWVHPSDPTISTANYQTN
jgi:hypothetical protein